MKDCACVNDETHSFSSETRKDIKQIWNYIAEENIRAADTVITDIFTSLDRASAFSEIGHRRPDLTAEPEIRFLTVRDYLISYRAQARYLEVIAVLRGSRDPEIIQSHLRDRT